MSHENLDLTVSNPRELGEQFKFITEVTEVIQAGNFEETSDKVNLIAAAGRFGILFIACASSLKVFKTKDLIDNHLNVPVSTIACRGYITHVSTSCDSLTLFIVVLVNNCPFGIFYDVRHVMQKGKDVVPFYSVPLTTNISSRVVSLSWNPCDPTCIALAFSTGDLSLMKIKNNSVEFMNKNGVGASAVTWSAKGKQLAVGKKDATVSLFKPDLTLVRSIASPSIHDVGPVFDITWFTNTEFFVAYLIMNFGSALVYVNAPKGKPPLFANFDDICYSIEREKPLSYYSVFVSEWNLLLVLSSNGEELAVMGKTNSEEENQCNWCVWSPDEGGKAVMHHFNVVEETFPLGLVIDYTSGRKFPFKDEDTKGPFPYLATISSKGELNVFFIENYLGNPQALIVQTENLPLSGHRTPEQFGQPTFVPLHQAVPETPPPSELKQNILSAFSSIPKKTEVSSSPTPLLFSTPIKSTFLESSIQISKSTGQSFTTSCSTTSFPPFSADSLFSTPASNLSSSYPISASVNMPFSSSLLITKPVSLSSQIAISSLPAPSPQKSEIFQSRASSSQNTLFNTPSLMFVTKPVATLPQSTFTTPLIKISKESVMYHIEREKHQFEKELQELRASIYILEKEIGKDSDFKLKILVENIKEFMNNMESTTQDQSDEISNLHQKTLEALALYEDANSQRQLKLDTRNEIYSQLRPLDPYSQRKLDEVRSKYQYLMSQICEVNTKLDLQWEEITSFRKPRKEERTSTDNLYRSILKLHTLRVSAEKELEKIIFQFKKLNTCSALSSSSFRSRAFDKLRDVHDLNASLYLQPPSQTRNLLERNNNLKEVLLQRSCTPVRVHSSDASTNMTEKYKENISLQNVEKIKLPTSLSNNFQNRSVYENISPSINRVASTNPLAALSSLVGKVPTPESEAVADTTLPVSKADISVGSFSFLENKQPIQTFSFNVKKDVSTGNFFEADIQSTQNSLSQISKMQVPSISSGSTCSKGASIQGFNTAYTTQPNNVDSSISSNSKSTLFEVSTKKNENGSSTATNFGQFFKGISAVSASVAASTPLFSIPGISIEKKTTKGNFLSSQNFANSVEGLATVSSSLPKMSVSESGLKQYEAKLDAEKIPLKEIDVLCANPILSSHILKETSSIVSSSIAQGGILGNIGMTTSIFPQESKSSSAVDTLSVPNTTTAGTSTENSFSIFGNSSSTSIFGSQSAAIFSTSGQSTSGYCLFGKPTSVINSVAVASQPTTSISFFAKPITSSSHLDQLSTSVFSFGQPPIFTSASFQPTTSVFSGSSGSTLFGQVPVSSLGSNSTVATTCITTAGSTPNYVLTSVQSSVSPPVLQSQTKNANLFSDQTSVDFLKDKHQAISSFPSTLTTTSSTSTRSTVLTTPPNLFSVTSSLSTTTSVTTVLGLNDSNIFSTAGLTEEISTSAAKESNKPSEGKTSSSLFCNVNTTSITEIVAPSSNSIIGNLFEDASTFGQISTPSVSSSNSLLSFLVTKDDKNSSLGDQGETNETCAPSGVFGSTTLTSQSIFGGTGQAVKSASLTPLTNSIFGGGSSGSTSIFDKPLSDTSQPSEQSPFVISSTKPSIFGGTGNALTFQSTSFGSSSVFGQTSLSASLSGVPTSTTTQSVFGRQTESPFGITSKSGSIFGNTKAQPTSTAADIFGEAKSSFSSTAGNIFGSTIVEPTTSSIFGSENSTSFSSESMFSGLGKAPSKENSSKNIFEALKSESTPQTNLFGGDGSTSNTFGNFSSQNTGTFSPIKSSTSFGGVAVFGGSPSFGDANKAKSIFGGGPALGSGSTFGGGPSFGGSPVLEDGTSSVYGSATSFSSTSPSGGFGSFASSGGTTFGNLAKSGSENTGFSQLSQQANANTGNSTRMFGGSSFTNWR